MEKEIQLKYLSLKMATSEGYLGVTIKPDDREHFFAEIDTRGAAWPEIQTTLADVLKDATISLGATNFLEAEETFRQLANDRGLHLSATQYFYVMHLPSSQQFIFSIEDQDTKSHTVIALRGWNFTFQPREAAFQLFVTTIYSDKICETVGSYSDRITITLNNEASSHNRLKTYEYIISLYDPA